MNRLLMIALLLVCVLMAATVLPVPTEAQAEAPAQKALTLMVYMCGSNLESQYGSGSADLEEMLASGFDSDQVSLLVMAGGTERWSLGFDPAMLTINEIGRRGIRAVWREESASMGIPETLTTFLNFGMERFPAENYALILWDHGGGPMGGVCWDELFSMDSIVLDELTQALDNASLPQKLRFIGFDACLMGSAEVAAALAPYAEYMIASQETEPARGWNYAFLNGIERDASGADTGRRIIDTYFEAVGDARDTLTLACIDLSRIESVETQVDRFFSPIGQALTQDNFTALSDLRFAATGFGRAIRGQDNQGYDLVDLGDLVGRYSRNASGSRVLSAISDAVVYARSNVEGASGLSVYHPFNNKKRYLERWRDDYENLDFSSGYTSYLNRFGSFLTGETLANWSGLAIEQRSSPKGTIYSLQLTPEQKETFASAQLVVLAAQDQTNGVYGTQMTAMEGSDKGNTLYSPVYAAEAEIDEDGLLTARYGGRALYAVDDEGRPILGPLPYQLSEDGTTYYVRGLYQDRSGREDFADDLMVMFGGELSAEGDGLDIVSVRGYDQATETYSSRIPVVESAYTHLAFYTEAREAPGNLDNLPGFEEWTSKGSFKTGSTMVRLPMDWSLRFFEDQMSASQLYVGIQVTDAQRNTHLTRPIALPNPNLESITMAPRIQENENWRLKAYLMRDNSPIDPGLNLVLETTNLSRWDLDFIFFRLWINDSRGIDLFSYAPIHVHDLHPNETRVAILHIGATDLMGLSKVTSLEADVLAALDGHSYDDVSFRFDVSGCGLAGIAPAVGKPIAKAEQNGLKCELISLEENRYKELTGIMRLTNNTDEDLEGSLYVAAEDLLVDGTNPLPDINVAAHGTAYVPFTLDNRGMLRETFRINGHYHSYWMASESVMSLYGLDQIQSLRCIITYTEVTHSMTLQLSEPLVLQHTDTEPPDMVPLMTGPVEAAVERVLLGDTSVGLRMLFTNHEDRDVTVDVGSRALNGRTSTSEEYGGFLVIPAGGRTVYMLPIQPEGALEEGEAIREVGMVFTVDDQYASPPVRLVIRPEAEPGYLQPEDYREGTECVTFSYEAEETHAGDDILASGSDGALLWELLSVEEDDSCGYTLKFRVTNETEIRQKTDHTLIVIDGVVAADWFRDTLEAGEEQVISVDVSNGIFVSKIDNEIYNYDYHAKPEGGLLGYPLETRVLEHRGIQQITELRIYSDMNIFMQTMNRMACLTLREPISLTNEEASLESYLDLLDENDFELLIGNLLVGDTAVTVSLDVINGTDKLLSVDPTSCSINGRICKFSRFTRDFTVPPHTISPVCVTIEVDMANATSPDDELFQNPIGDQAAHFQLGDLIRTFDLGFKTLTGVNVSGSFTVLREAPLGIEGGVFLPNAMIQTGDVNPVALLVYGTPVMEATSLTHTRLAPVLDADQVARFASGKASVMIDRSDPYRIVDEAGEDGDYLFLPTRGIVCQLDLVEDEEGIIAAEYPELALVNTVNQPLEFSIVPFEDEENSFVVDLVATLFKDPDALRDLPPEISIFGSGYDAIFQLFLLVEDHDGPAFTDGAYKFFKLNMEEIDGQSVADEGISLAVASWRVLVLKGDEVWAELSEKKPLLTINDLRFVPLEELPGQKYVYYEITYTDGTEESFFEPYPD